MKLFRFGEKGKERPGMVLADGSWIDTSVFGEDYDENFFGNRGLARLRRWAATFAGSAPRIAPDRVRIGSPIVRPSKIIGIGLNFRDHAKESRMEIPSEPVVFMKATSAVSGPFDELVVPQGASKVDWEVELGLVIGRTARSVPEIRAPDYIAGFLIVNDVSERSFQLERLGQWVKGKSADGFAPMGPLLLTIDEMPNVHDLKMRLSVNGKTMQDSATSQMIFGVHQLVSYVSHFMTLLPGDVISTGTPAGVGFARKPPRFLQPGDEIEVEIEGLGRQRQRIVAWQR